MGATRGRIINGEMRRITGKQLQGQYRDQFREEAVRDKRGLKGHVLHFTGMEAGLPWALKLDWRWAKTWLPATSRETLQPSQDGAQPQAAPRHYGGSAAEGAWPRGAGQPRP